jgi:ABC-type Fe3+-hydroxamate transport system substrate-binding protein
MKHLAILTIGLSLFVTACADTAIVGGSGNGASGIQGKVLIGPMCPVQQAGSPCPDKPTKADITVTDANGKTVATGHSDADGTYRISLSAGSYTVVAMRPDDSFGFGKPVTVEVSGGTFVHLNLVVDSGIR